MSEEPICVASRMRCASPPDSEPALRARVRYSSPTLLRKPSRERISLRISLAIISSVLFSFKFSKKSTSALTESAHSSLMFSPPTVTASDSFFSRRPPQVGQGTSFINA